MTVETEAQVVELHRVATSADEHREDTARQVEFADFVRTHWATLMAVGLAVTGSRHDAEDVVQSALTNAYRRWERLRPEDALAYLRRSIVNGNVTRWRRTRRLVSVSEVPEHAGSDDTETADTRHSLVPLVRELPPRQRAVIVLRYLCDLSDADIAQTLGISQNTVRSQAMRGLTALRARAIQDTEETS